MDVQTPTAVEVQRFLAALYARGEVEGEDGHVFPVEPTGLRAVDSEALYALAIQAGARTTIETGFGYGLSGLTLCRALLENGGAVRHVAMDPAQTALWGNAGRKAFRDAGIDALLEFYEETSQVTLPRMAAEGRTFDLGFIDGDHRFDSVFVDFYYMHRLIRPGGLIIVDDMWMPAVACAMRFFETNLGYERSAANEVAHKRGRTKPHPQTAIYHRPDGPDRRAWDHFEPFA